MVDKRYVDLNPTSEALSMSDIVTFWDVSLSSTLRTTFQDISDFLPTKAHTHTTADITNYPANLVNTFNSRTGNITPLSSDYSAFYATTAQGTKADSALQPGFDLSVTTNYTGLLPNNQVAGLGSAALQPSSAFQSSNSRLTTISNQANPASVKLFQLNTDGTVTFVDPTAATVTSVFGRSGAVTAQSGDYSSFYATTTQGAKADSALQPGFDLSVTSNYTGLLPNNKVSGLGSAALQPSSAFQSTNSRLTTISNQANPASIKLFQLNTDGTVTFVDPQTIPVTSVFGRSGAVVAVSTDYSSFYADINHTHAVVTTSVNGFMSAADKTKLDGIATGATANATDAQLRDRTTHTGVQAISTVTNLQATLDAKVALTSVGIANGVASLDANAKVPLAQMYFPSLDNFRQNPVISSDFMNITTASLKEPFASAVIATGTLNAANASIVTRHHPGVVRVRSSTTTNSGASFLTGASTFLIGGNEIFEVIISFPQNTSNLHRYGFLDTTGASDAVDGLYFEVSNTLVVVAKSSSNSIRTTSATILTASINTWYRMRIAVNSAATSVTYTIFNDSGTSLGTTNITTNIPTASGRETGAGAVLLNTGITAVDLAHVDYMAVGYAAALTR